ncbi:MAG: YggT family protein [Candidatus Omnitrophica bacterium]|nr:YggT family protein [Candidatus Omnitrophota bacterium]
MFIVGQLFASLAMLASMVFKILYFLLVIRIIMSWFAADSFSGPASIIYTITDPILAPFRRLPLQIGVVDLSPILAFLLLSFLDSFVVGLLQHFAVQFGSGV